jgi:hypothetical protein
MASDDPDCGRRAPRDHARQIVAMFKRALPEDLPVLDSQDVARIREPRHYDFSLKIKYSLIQLRKSIWAQSETPAPEPVIFHPDRLKPRCS